MDWTMFLLLATTAAASGAVPGPCLMLVAGRSLRDGFGAGLAVAAGIMLSKVVLLWLAWMIVLGVLEISTVAQETLRLGGAAVLALLAVAMLQTPEAKSLALETGAGTTARSGGLAAGLCVGLASPLNLVFMLAVLPQVVDLDGSGADELALVGLAVLAGGLPPLVAAAVLAGGCRAAFSGASCWLGRAAALTLLGFAGATVLPLP